MTSPDGDRPEIDAEILEKWQEIVDILCSYGGAAAGLIMKLTGDQIEVFVSSRTRGNPYTTGSREHLENSGLYCERVVRTKQTLIVPNALKSPEWDRNPDLKLNMISYLGFPILYPDGEPFGTLCVLDRNENGYDERLIRLMDQFKAMVEMHLELLEKNRRLEEMALHDSLTGLLNRNGFDRIIDREISRSLRFHNPVALVFGDIDHFKEINDTWGHDTGDEVLKWIGALMEGSVRKHDYVVRWGGEEFLILFPHTDLGQARSAAESLRRQIEGSFVEAGATRIRMTMSFGVAVLGEEEDLSSGLRRCDQLLYLAKESGRNRVCTEEDRE